MVLLQKQPTIQDVARHAEVSAATVSRALSTPERVSVTTRARIEAAIKATGYTINEAARTLRRQRAQSIVIALPNAGNPFYSSILDAVVAEATGRGYGVLVANRQDHDATGWLRDYFFSSRADGLLIFDATLDTVALQRLMKQRGNLPIMVMCDEVIEPRFNLVTSDNRAATGRVVEHLIALGHRRIGLVTGPTVQHYPNERTRGYHEAMARAGLGVRPEWIIPGRHTTACGFAAGSAYLALAERPSAMVCANDEMAVGFISRLHQAGVRCPEEVSVVGFDDIDIARYLWPPLTTMHQKRAELGRVSSSSLIDIIEGRRESAKPVRETLTCDLVVRASTAPPPDGA